MKRRLFIWVLFSAVNAFSGDHINVAVCNIGELPARAIERAEIEAAYVFRTMGVEVHWTNCGVELGTTFAFIVRVRVGGHIKRTH